MSTVPALVFWACAALVGYTYAGYAAVIWICSRIWGRREVPPPTDGAAAPTVSVLIAAHDEADVIGARVENALALDYPPDKLEIIVASDGSRDATAEIVRSFADRGVRLLDYRVNRGKAATLNAALAEARGDVVLLSDANTFTEPAAARCLARWFHDPRVGAVCGRLVLRDPVSGRNVDGLYWRYETFLKACEGRLHALLGANGAIYAIRRRDYVAIPPDTIVDDFVIPLLVRLRHGARLIYDVDAVAHEETPPAIADEFKRRARIGAGDFQSLRVLWPLLSPRYGWLAFSFLSHKLLRWGSPFFLLGMAVSNAMLIGVPIYRGLLVAQIVFYAMALAGAGTAGRHPVGRIVRLATLFSATNAALLVGFCRWLMGRQQGAWARTAR